MKEIATTFSAVKWYAKHGHGQYEGANLLTYDYAATVLTRRHEYATHILSELNNNPGRILEVAAGTGLISETLSNHFPRVVYTDYARGALGLLQERISSGDVAQASFYELPFKTHSFDTIVNVGGYRYVSLNQRQKFWDEMDRVLSPGGKLIIGQFYPRGKAVEGSNIQNDIRWVPPYFTLENATRFDAKLGPRYMQLRSGAYSTFIFKHSGTLMV